VKQDYSEAANWLRRAALQGDTNAQLALGEKLFTGQGVAKNPIEAHKWFNLAAAQGEKGAADWRAKAAEEMSRDQVIEAQKRATAFVPGKENPAD
jgi:TPR repeat protein